MSSSDSDNSPGPGGSYYYPYWFTMNADFCEFFGLDPRYRYGDRYLNRIVFDYGKSHYGITKYTFHYDEGLWKVFGLPADKRFKTYRIDRYVKKLCLLLRPCPICEKPRPFKSYYPNGLCKECSEPYKELYKPKYVSFMQHIDPTYTAIDVTPSNSPETIVVQGIYCKRTYSDDPILEAIANCPICHVEVKEERRLGAFCEACSRSEDLKDANGNRVRFKRPTYYDKQENGYAVLHYENGEIVKRFHVGEFPCFFRGVPAVAEDTGIHDTIIVRFRDKESELITWEHVRILEPVEPTAPMVQPLEQTYVGPTNTDWLVPSYPRWATW